MFFFVSLSLSLSLFLSSSIEERDPEIDGVPRNPRLSHPVERDGNPEQFCERFSVGWTRKPANTIGHSQDWDIQM